MALKEGFSLFHAPQLANEDGITAMVLRRNRRNRRNKLARMLKLESLEDRRLLTTFVLDNLLDASVFAAGDVPGSLRQAIFDATRWTSTQAIHPFGQTSNRILVSLLNSIRIS